jgi:hypothetical protein
LENNMTSDRNWGEAAFRVASALSIPRLVGSAGEREARARVREMFSEAGLVVEEEFFYCSDFAIRVAARWALAPTGSLLLLAAVMYGQGWFLPSLIAAAAALLPAAYMASRAQTGFRSDKQVSKYRCANITGQLPDEPENGMTVVLMAHYDSKSQTFPIWLRVALFIITGLLSLLLTLCIIAFSIAAMIAGSGLLGGALVAGGVLVFLLSLSFLLNSVGNLSDGALDNATGVGIVAEIAARLKDDQPDGLKVRAVATAAEEIGLCGANAYLDAHRDELDPANTVIINFDGCGGDRTVGVLHSYGIPRKKISREIMDHLKEISISHNIALRPAYIPLGMATDLMPFRKVGYKGIDFIGMAGKSHTAGDRMELVNERTLADYVLAGFELAKRLASPHTEK